MKNFRLKLQRTRKVTDTMTVTLRAKSKLFAIKAARKGYRSDTGTLESNTSIVVKECVEV